METMRKKNSVLYIEDDVVDQIAFKRFVTSQDNLYDYKIAGCVAEAKSVIESGNFDIVISDYQLGDGTALDILGMKLDSPVIIATGAGNEEVAVNALKAGACDYLVKDVERNYLKIMPITVENAVKRKQSEEKIQMLSHAITSIHDSVYIADMDGKIIFVNKAFRETYGYDDKDVIGHYIAVLDEKILNGEYFHRRNGNGTFPVSLSKSVIRNDDGEPVAMVGVARDITERKRMEEELQSAHKALSARHEQMLKELELARRVQKSLIPPPEFKIRNLEFNVNYQPFEQVGGDLCVAVQLPNGRVLMAIADAEGHGVSSSLVISLIKSSFMLLSRTDPSPAAILSGINQQLMNLFENGMMLPCAVAVYNPDTGLLLWANAGHPPILVHRANGELETLESSSMFPGYDIKFSTHEASTALNSGDRLIFYTDGIYEFFNPSKELFGEVRFNAVIKDNHKLRPRALADVIFRTQAEFLDGRPLMDDSTLMIVDVSACE